MSTVELRVAAKIAKSKGLSIIKLGLRFDRVAKRLAEDLRGFTEEIAPPGISILLTITAPIRLPVKTAAALKERIKTLLARESVEQDQKASIHGNGVRMRLLREVSKQAPKLILFVHNPDSDPVMLLDATLCCFEDH